VVVIVSCTEIVISDNGVNSHIHQLRDFKVLDSFEGYGWRFTFPYLREKKTGE
jgi:hypothetical protein